MNKRAHANLMTRALLLAALGSVACSGKSVSIGSNQPAPSDPATPTFSASAMDQLDGSPSGPMKLVDHEYQVAAFTVDAGDVYWLAENY
ncbi:MAG TPA: hypothetical protein VGM29_07350, partial [Polyangiaceae bacterium]